MEELKKINYPKKNCNFGLPKIEPMTIKTLSLDDRPREKLVKSGRTYLSDAELLAIIIGSGNRTENSVQLAQRMLYESDGDINKLAKLSINDLKKYKGIGVVKAINISAAFELGRRRLKTSGSPAKKIQSSKDAYILLQDKLSDLSHEEAWMLLLNRANKVIQTVNLSKGGMVGTQIDIRLILKTVIEHKAVGIILAHNHPSGNLLPSESDITLTKSVQKAAALIDVSVLDHLIIGDNAYYSFADSGGV
jgi:DNA repair protein RadC